MGVRDGMMCIGGDCELASVMDTILTVDSLPLTGARQPVSTTAAGPLTLLSSCSNQWVALSLSPTWAARAQRAPW
jgi:hypothetical protein